MKPPPMVELWNTDVTIIPKPDGMKAYIQFALDGLDQGTQLPFVIVRSSDNRVVGTTRFYEIRDSRSRRGYWLHVAGKEYPKDAD
jgi:hypothetical protein